MILYNGLQSYYFKFTFQICPCIIVCITFIFMLKRFLTFSKSEKIYISAMVVVYNYVGRRLQRVFA